MKGMTAALVAIVIAGLLWMLFPTSWYGDSYYGGETQEQFAATRALVLAYPEQHRGLPLHAEVGSDGDVSMDCDGTPLLWVRRDPDGRTSFTVVKGAESRAPDIDVLTQAMASQLGVPYKPNMARHPLRENAGIEAFVLKWRDGMDFSRACGQT